MQTKDSLELTKAAKYLCTTLDGLCPMVVEKYPCPENCNTDTMPWKCWIAFFSDPLRDGGPIDEDMNGTKSSPSIFGE